MECDIDITEMMEAKYCMTVNQKEENRSGCSAPTGHPERDMESILNEMQEWVCHEICKLPENITEDEKKQFCRNCRFDELVDQAIETYENK